MSHSPVPALSKPNPIRKKEGEKGHMSDNDNTNLLERAAELLDELDSHPSGLQKHLEQAVEGNDLDSIRYWVERLEGHVAREHFHGYEVTVW